MAEGFASFWRTDLTRALAVGLEGGPNLSEGADRALLIWAAVCGLVAAGLYLNGGYHAGFHALNDLGSAQPQWPWELVTVLGDERLLFALALLVCRRYPRVLWALVLAGVIGAGYTHGLKLLVGAARPPAVLQGDALNLIGAGHRKGSFPSGHSLTIAMFLGVGFGFTRERWLRWGLVILAAEIAGSRVVVGVHWPVDVAAGLMGGVLAAWVGNHLSQRWGWGVRLPGHAVLVSLAVLFVLRVLGDRGDYPDATWLLGTVAFAGVGLVAWGYGIVPWLRWRGDETRLRTSSRLPGVL